MNTQRIKHAIGLLGTIAVPLLTVWGDAGTDLGVKLAVTIALLIPLVWSNPAEQARITTAILAGIPVATIVVSFLVARMSGTAVAGSVGTVVLAVLTQLSRVLRAQPIVAGVVVPSSTPTPVTAPATPSAIEATKVSLRERIDVPLDGLTADANPCHACPTKLPPEWRVQVDGGVAQFCLCCCMCGRQTNWVGDWKGLLDWWNSNNPTLPNGDKAPTGKGAA